MAGGGGEGGRKFPASNNNNIKTHQPLLHSLLSPMLIGCNFLRLRDLIHQFTWNTKRKFKESSSIL